MIGSRNVSAGLAIGLTAALLTMMTAAYADETVRLGATDVVLIKPTGSPRASVILMPGGDGYIGAGPNGEITNLQQNQLVRTRHAYAQHGLAVMVVDAETNLASAVEYMRRIKGRVTVVATSRGTIRAAKGIAAGARPDALVLTSGMLSPESGNDEDVKSILDKPEALPPTLVIHHSKDACDITRRAGVAPFIKWAGDRARVLWVSAGSPNDPGEDRCGALHYHGFWGIEDTVVSLVAGFVLSGDLATPLPASVTGKWVYRDYDKKAGHDKPNGYTTDFEVSADGTVKAKDGGRGKVVSYGNNEIQIENTNGEYKMIIWWPPQTAIGYTLFSAAPGNSPKSRDQGPYDISMRRN